MNLAVVDDHVIFIKVVGSHSHLVGDYSSHGVTCGALVDPGDGGSYFDLDIRILKAGRRTGGAGRWQYDVNGDRALIGHIKRRRKLPGSRSSGSGSLSSWRTGAAGSCGCVLDATRGEYDGHQAKYE